jgi:NADH-quinone oxidoreductase subunit N
MGALSSGLLLMGCTSIYLETGETNWSAISSFGLYSDTDLVIGSILVVIALLFKLAAAPFHMWVPDVYEGSPTIVTGYFATVPKIALISTLWNLIKGPFIGVWSYHLQYLILGSAILSIIIAGIGGINQAIIKRLIGYSAIGHGFHVIRYWCFYFR